ncbi:hypothetical protein Tco_0123649 [Tanacetum coccineum]
MEVEFWNLSIKGTDIMGYTNRIQELALVFCQQCHSPEYMKITLQSGSLAARDSKELTSSKPTYNSWGAIPWPTILRGLCCMSQGGEEC